MLILTEATDAIEVVLGAAHTTNPVQCFAAWRDLTTTAFTPGRTAQDTNGTTSVDAVTGPASSTQRVIDLLNVYNNDTITHTVTVKFDANGTECILWKGSLTTGQTLSYVEGAGWSVSNGTLGYALYVGALTSNPTDAQTIYFGSRMAAPSTTAAQNKVWIPKAGTIKRADIQTLAGTAGTGENWSLYIRVNNTTDYLIQTVGAAAAERVFTNSSLAIAVAAGDYIEIKAINPTWVTNPATWIPGGYVYVE